MSRARLIYRLECRPLGQHFFEDIAAFNCERAAVAYVLEGRKTNRLNTYRVYWNRGRVKARADIILGLNVLSDGSTII
jgi:hypothetical protein